MGQEAHSSAFARASEKFAKLSEYGHSSDPASRSSVLTAREWNAYFDEGGVQLPEGVSGIHVTSEPSIAHGDAEVDFDRLTANRIRSNPLLALFTGKHHVTVTAHASAADGMATVHVESVLFDGVQIPRLALEYFASRFLRPRFGNAVGMDSTFALHHRIDSAIVGMNQVTITQR
jgi:hypothetical protein